MKKIAFIILIGLGSLTATAQVTDPTQQPTDPTQQPTDPTQQAPERNQPPGDPTQPQTTNPDQQIVDPTQEQITDPTERRTSDFVKGTGERGSTTQSQDGYNEIAKREVPGKVKKAFKQNYPKAKIEQAYSNEEGQFKLDVSMKDGASETLFMDKEGNPMEH
ncbi:MAG TPA: hypothetical protein VFM69_07110 [Pricia sp.]|nr:hypothetical protein [Pricia sp.]